MHDRGVTRKYKRLMKHCHRYMEGVEAGSDLPFSVDDLRLLCLSALEVGLCYHCGGYLCATNWSCDHIKPLSRGGTSDLYNIRIICWGCNQSKRGRDEDEFHKSITNLRRIYIKGQHYSNLLKYTRRRLNGNRTAETYNAEGTTTSKG